MSLASVEAAWSFLAGNGTPATRTQPAELGVTVMSLIRTALDPVCRSGHSRFLPAFLAASALQVYPLGTGRADIFTFPLSICLFTVGVHLATEALPPRNLIRLAAAILAVAIAVARPLHVESTST